MAGIGFVVVMTATSPSLKKNREGKWGGGKKDRDWIHRVVMIPPVGSNRVRRYGDGAMRGLIADTVNVSGREIEGKKWMELVEKVWSERKEDRDKCVLLGESTGGTLALLMACRKFKQMPKKVTHLILVNPVTAPRLDLTTIARTVPSPLLRLVPDFGTRSSPSSLHPQKET